MQTSRETFSDILYVPPSRLYSWSSHKAGGFSRSPRQLDGVTFSLKGQRHKDLVSFQKPKNVLG